LAPDPRVGCRKILAELLGAIEGLDSHAAADRLIGHFGSLRATLSASPGALLRICAGDDRIVRLVRAARRSMLWSLRSELGERPQITNVTDLVDYLRLGLGQEACEQVRLLLLDVKMRLIRDELISRGSPDSTPIDVRDVITRGLESGAASLILVHNHPSGDPSPSQADRDVTRRIHAGAHCVGLHLADHLIVTPDSYFSFRAHHLV